MNRTVRSRPPIRTASPDTFVGLCADVATFYGFQSQRAIERTVPAALRTQGIYSFESLAKLHSTGAFDTTGAPPRESLLSFYASQSPAYLPPTMNTRDTGEFGLTILGSRDSLGEILLIKIAMTIFAEWGVPVTAVRINALGDRESQQRFLRELSIFLKKHAITLTGEDGSPPSNNPIEQYRLLVTRHPELASVAPRPVNFLSEKSRSHFRNLLEQLELLGVPYQLDHTLTGDARDQRVIFTIDTAEVDPILHGGIGGRLDDHLRRTVNQKEASAVHAGLYFNRKGLNRTSYTFAESPEAKVCLVQLGTRAKIHALGVVDMLRAARIPALQTFEANHLSHQLSIARDAGVSHVIIMGSREVLDNTVIVRSADQRTQTTVALTQLPRFLKTLRI